MAQQLGDFVAPITDQLPIIHDHFTQLSLSIQEMNKNLQSQVDTLIRGAGDNSFQGMGADAFNEAIEYYLGIANQHSSTLDQAATLTRTCHLQLFNAVDTAQASNPHPIIVTMVLNQVTLDQVVEQGSTPVEDVLQKIRQTLKDMATQAQNYGKDMRKSGQSFGQAFSDFFHGNFGGAWHDLQQSGSEFGQSWADLGQFMLDCGELTWESIFEMTAAALIQCAQDIWQAIKTCAQGIGNLWTKAVRFLEAGWELIKDEGTFDYDMVRGDYNDALLALIAEEINPILIMEGQQPLSQSQIQEMIPKSLWQWFKGLPGWLKVILIVVVALIIVGILLFGASSGGNTKQQRRINRIKNELQDKYKISASNNQIKALIEAGYTDDQIIAILRTSDLSKSASLYITDYAGRKVYGHTLSLHVNIDNTDLKNRARTRQDLATTFSNQSTAQKAVNYAIANSSKLQNFIKNGAPGTTQSDDVCYNTKPLPNLGYGYQPVPPPPKVERVGPLHCMHVVLAKTIAGIIFVLTAYPIP